MADKTLTVNGQPFTFNRDKFAGVRTMTTNELDYDEITVSNAASDVNGTWELGQGGNATSDGRPRWFHSTNTSATIYRHPSVNSRWFIQDDDDDPKMVQSGTTVYDYPWEVPSWESFGGGTTYPNVAFSDYFKTITVDRTAPVITSDRKGASRPLLSKLVGGAAAAYSLRDLNDRQGNNKVVRVRRASDNHERDFLAKEVSNGTLKNWVNTQTVLPLDIKALTNDGRTGSVIPAKAAYSFRNLSSTYTGNVVDVRRSSDNTVQGFTASQITDGTLTSFVNVGHQYTGYSFFAAHALARVNLSSSIALLSTEDWSMKFKVILGEPSSNGYGIFKNPTTGQNGSLFIPDTRNSLGFTNDSGSFINVNLTTSIIKAQPTEIEIINQAGSGITIKVDGVTSSNQVSIGNVTFNAFGNGRGRLGERGVFDTEIDLTGNGTVDHKYVGDGITNSNWADQAGSNNGTIHNSSYISAYNNSLTSGFASKWYDQTGNGKHATQTNPDNQPIIIEEGLLWLSTTGEGALGFDGDQSLELPSDIYISSAVSIFTVVNAQDAEFDILGSDGQGSGSFGLKDSQNYHFSTEDGTEEGDLGTTLTVNNFNLLTAIYAAPAGQTDKVVTSFANGTEGENIAIGNAAMEIMTIGDGGIGTPLEGSIKEIIIYDSDQTDNRTAIEANIAEAHSLTGIPAYDNTVDGFVETWYDQSGHGRDATQPASSDQPKIVDGGNYLGELEFNTDSFEIPAITAKSIFAVMSANTGVTGSNKLIPIVSNTTTTAKSYIFISNNQSPFNGYAISLDGQNLGDSGSWYLNGTFKASGGNIGTFGDIVSGETMLQTIIYTTAGDPATTVNTIGKQGDHTQMNGTFKELIIYSSDQSANRPAIEANINNQHDIYS